jgi:acyl-CoA synthetase (AMP-forming)/AMP-acid ligase II
MAGYLGRPDASAELVDARRWLRTGDLGHVDETATCSSSTGLRSSSRSAPREPVR